MAFEEVELSPEEKAALAVKFFKFDAIGDRLAGAFERHEIKDGKYGKESVYTFRVKNQASGQVELLAFTAPMDADQKLKKAKLEKGHRVMITFASTMDVGKEHPMKIFKVLVDRAPAAAKPPPPPPPPMPADDLDF